MHLALYRKYRSASFDEVISQEHITTTLKNQIKTATPAHAYLFTGSRGTGKTTCAKLMAKAVNCLSPKNGNPCGECESCRAIAEGCPDIIEMDAASNNGVDDVRALRDEVMYSPTVCRYKVYIIDEVHMLSVQAFNALLKTLEEPPAHVIFILATTELHKVPATISSRCQQFRFNRIDARQSADRLCEIAKKEGVSLTEDAALLISRLSDGGMRDAVSLLDQCISVSGEITEEVVRSITGTAGAEYLFKLAEYINSRNAAQALKLLDELHSQSKDLILLLGEMTEHFRNLSMLIATNMDFSFIPPGSGDKNALQSQARDFTQGEIMRCMDILQECTAKASTAANRKIAAEMCFVRLCTPRLDSDVTSLSLRMEKIEQRLDAAVGGNPAAADRPWSIADTIRQIENAEAKKSVFHVQPKAADIHKNESPVPKAVQQAEEIARQKPSAEAPLAQAPTEEAEELPFDVGGQVVAQPAPTVTQPADDSGKPDWLFEGDDTPPAPMDEIPFDTSEAPIEADGDEVPPFDLEDDTPASLGGLPEYPLPEAPNEADNEPVFDGQVADSECERIVQCLPSIIQAVMRTLSIRLEGDSMIIGGCKRFHTDFLNTGDSRQRITAAAKEVTGRDIKVLLEGEEAAAEEKSDRLSEFLKNAESMGVNIKYKNKR